MAEQTSWVYIDLFAGAGGASLGFRQAGAKPILVVDSDHVALQHWTANVKNIAPNTVKCQKIGTDDLDLPTPHNKMHLHASSPCQSFSSAKTTTTTEEAAEGIRLLRLSLDAALSNGYASWTIENVATNAVLQIVNAYTHAFQNRVAYAVLDASDYGSPSSRKRMYVGPPKLISELKSMPTQPRKSARAAFAEHGLTLPDGAVALTVSRALPRRKTRLELSTMWHSQSPVATH